jgi:hypothetical protein
LIEVSTPQQTQRRRLVTSNKLRSWLAPYRASVRFVQLAVAHGGRSRAGGIAPNWPPNALRHSSGSYHLAQFKDTAALALQMGNFPIRIFRHYRELVRPKDAARYWQIKLPLPLRLRSGRLSQCAL